LTANRAWGEAADAQTLGLHFLTCQRCDVEKTADIWGFFGCSDKRAATLCSVKHIVFDEARAAMP